jgi:4-diphosphocytidyl-2-C-methyl-D-erythritol kinase
MVENAPAKINLCLFLGPTRADGRHELVTVFDSVSLCDKLEIRVTGETDAVVCEGVTGPNLVAEALAGLRAAGWQAPPVRVVVGKRIPVAAGMGGGSADAAAMLRCAPRLSAISDTALVRIAASLGADVPAQLRPGASLGTGAGETVMPLRAVGPYGVLILAQPFALATPEVYREADRLGLGRSSAELANLATEPLQWGVNDLQPAALSLAPQLQTALARAREAGADHALVCGSGPTVIGLYRGPDGAGRAQRAVRALGEGVAAAPVRGGDDEATPNE